MTKMKDYPEPQGRRHGVKVSWSYYDSEDDAKKAAEAAKSNARILAGQGYDFGYMAPGSVEKVTDGEFAGKFMVCLP